VTSLFALAPLPTDSPDRVTCTGRKMRACAVPMAVAPDSGAGAAVLNSKKAANNMAAA